MPASAKRYGLALILVLWVFSLYAYVLRSGFINYDDQGYVYQNSQVVKGLDIGGIRWAFTSTIQSNWHPLSWMSHMLDVSLYGLKPGGHHFTSLLLHLLNTLLVLWVFCRLTGDFWPSFLLAALFAIHPMHIESVAWIAERKDVLSTFFFLLTILAYHAYTQHGKWWRMAGVTGLFALGLMAKPMIITLPFVLLLLDYWPLARFNPRTVNKWDAGWGGWCFQWIPPARLWLEKTPLFAVSGLSCLVTLIVQAGSMAGMQAIPFTNRLLNALTGYGLYIIKAVWPIHLSIFYPLAEQPSEWPGLFSGLVLLIISVLVSLKRSPRYLFFGWFFFLGTLIPVIGLVQVGTQAIADRYTYIPYLGLFVMAVYGGAAIQKRGSYSLRLTALALAGFALVAFSFLTSRHVPRWRNSQTIFGYAISIMPKNAEALFHLADDATEHQKYSKAISLYLDGLTYNPTDAKALNNLGSVYLITKNYQEALKYYDAALRIYPGYSLAFRNRAIAMRSLGTNPHNGTLR